MNNFKQIIFILAAGLLASAAAVADNQKITGDIILCGQAGANNCVTLDACTLVRKGCTTVEDDIVKIGQIHGETHEWPLKFGNSCQLRGIAQVPEGIKLEVYQDDGDGYVDVVGGGERWGLECGYLNGYEKTVTSPGTCGDNVIDCHDASNLWPNGMWGSYCSFKATTLQGWECDPPPPRDSLCGQPGAAMCGPLDTSCGPCENKPREVKGDVILCGQAGADNCVTLDACTLVKNEPAYQGCTTVFDHIVSEGQIRGYTHNWPLAFGSNCQLRGIAQVPDGITVEVYQSKGFFFGFDPVDNRLCRQPFYVQNTRETVTSVPDSPSCSLEGSANNLHPETFRPIAGRPCIGTCGGNNAQDCSGASGLWPNGGRHAYCAFRATTQAGWTCWPEESCKANGHKCKSASECCTGFCRKSDGVCFNNQSHPYGQP